jgi:hypothetical protein
MGLCGLACVTALFVRFRRARGIERQQLKWFLFACVITVAVVVEGQLESRLPTLPLVASIPVAVGIGILRYRLYDIDLLLKRTVAYGLLTAGITVVYLAVVVGIGTLIGSRGKPNLLLSIVATALIAVVFQPANAVDGLQSARLRQAGHPLRGPLRVLARDGRRLHRRFLAADGPAWWSRPPVRCRSRCGCGWATCCSRMPAGPRPDLCQSPSRLGAAASSRPWPRRRRGAGRFPSGTRTSYWERSP